MTMTELEFHGVHIAQPEEFFCAVLRVSTTGKIIPVWMSPIEGGKLAARHQGFSPRRPDTHDLLINVLEEQSGGVEDITISSYYEGVFIADVQTASGEVLDVRLSDALVLAEYFEVPVMIDSELANSVAVFASKDDLLEYLDLDLPTPDGVTDDDGHPERAESESASGNAQADADFSEMMRSLGMSEEDFLGDNNPDDEDDTGVTGDANR